MKNKRNRLQIISEILRTSVVGSQEELLKILIDKQCEVTQATLSRDLKLLKVAKTPLSNGTYKYVLPSYNKPTTAENNFSTFGEHTELLSIDFSGQLGVIKTKPGYASAVAWIIDNKATEQILGTIAGDDTILVIPREGVSRNEVINGLNIIFSNN
jgi:transcriptional regulator of arginine metabolism